MDTKFKGSICGILAAVSYGTNPLGALFLYEAGINANSVLFYRFSLAAVVLGLWLVVHKESFRVAPKELAVLGGLGILFAISSLSFFISFHHMDAGIASTLLFVYPVMVAVIMALFFKEKLSLVTAVSILLALGGIGFLYKGDNGSTLSTVGVVLVMLSSLSYALYIIVVNRSSLHMSSVKLTFYVLLCCTLAILLYSLTGAENRLQLLTTPYLWGFALMLALIPTVISLVLMVVAVHALGSTSTAIMGALEPLTAVVIGITVFGEMFTTRLAVGILMIVSAVILIIAGKSLPRQRLTGPLGHLKPHFLKRSRRR